jgi:tRNA-2-methylthio-N6-dimethylallyladenosine synthase
LAWNNDALENSAMTRKVHIKSYGCQMNVYDSGRMAGLLAEIGYRLADTPDEADLIILNTCHIREKAAEKVYSDIGRFRALKEKGKTAGRDMIIAVAGCVAQAEGEEIIRRAPVVELVFGPQTYHRLPELLESVATAKKSNQPARIVDTEFPVEEKFDHLAKKVPTPGPSAFLTIQEGCDKFCTFCVVPYTRGGEFSRPVEEIVLEARALAAKGAREITLLGQNVNAFHGLDKDGNEAGLGGLIRQLAGIEGLARIRYTTSHPRDMEDDLIAAHGEIETLMPHLHLPVQSGSDRILKTMNRGHSAGDYLKLVEKIRKSRPDIALSSDFIVGFPGEQEEDFEKTLGLVKEVSYTQAYSFKYSPRPGTPAATAPEQIPEDVKTDRLAVLQEILNAQQQAFNQTSVGKKMTVLFERHGKHKGQIVGRSPYMQAVHVTAVDAKNCLGDLKEVEILAAGPNSLKGRLMLPANARSAA